MGSMYRGEDMVLCQMYLQSDAAYNTVAQLGELGIVQFRDLKAGVNVFQRQFVNEIRRCDEMERQIRFFERELKKEELDPVDLGFNPDTPAARDMIDLEAVFEHTESELKDLNINVETLERNFLELQEIKCVLRCTDEFFQESLFTQASHEMELGYYAGGEVDSSATETAAGHQLNYIAGVIPVSRINGFNRMLFLTSRGNIFFRHYEISERLKDPGTGDLIQKAVFMAVYQGKQLNIKVKQISEGYHATLYPCLDSYEERAEMLRGVGERMSELQTVLDKSREQRERTLRNIAQNVRNWELKVIKLKAVYHAMNMFQNEGQNFLCECWLPYNEMGTVKAVLAQASDLSSGGNRLTSLVHPIEARVLPTYHKTNKFTMAFQAIIDAYGVANYKEVNPALFSIITFPFLFSVMFGDCGHALVMLAFALYLVISERKLQALAESSEIFSLIFSGRYLVLVMSLFSLYSGLMYNDMFSKSVNIFRSAWHVNYTDSTIRDFKDLTLDPSDIHVYHRTPYVFGVDPVWQLSMNKITFTNSFKKKISVIFGVGQMLLGVILSLCNHIYFRKPVNILCEFIPQLIFLMVIFGYLCALIFAKWLTFYEGPEYYSCSPNILIDFINMFMMQYPAPTPGCKASMYPGQNTLQTVFVILAVICALWMLLSKPLYLLFKHKKSQGHHVLHETDVNDGGEGGLTGSEPHRTEGDHERQLLRDEHHRESVTDHRNSTTEPVLLDNSPPMDQPLVQNGAPRSFTMPMEHEEPFQSGEVFIHQAIHTIEFCLGCISHTASYLRLWALSLAHAQLSEVLWSMVMHSGLVLLPYKYVGAIPIFVVFAPFAVLTVVILLLMEGLSAFLHTLRLHWVEFNSKFYGGDGMAFEPFSFYKIIHAQEN